MEFAANMDDMNDLFGSPDKPARPAPRPADPLVQAAAAAKKPAPRDASDAYDASAIEVLEGLEQLRFLESGTPVLCVEVEARDREFWELNNPSDVPRIEAMMATMGMA